MIGAIIGFLFVGGIVGALGRFFHRGPDPMPWWLTLGIGVVSSLVAGILIGSWLGWLLGFVASVLLAVILVGYVGRVRPAR
jgi:uncharacterized membrane protein YeaQ/YmgE (transglycosylase-associated protein family)